MDKREFELIAKLGESLRNDEILLTGFGEDYFECLIPRDDRTDQEIMVIMKQAKVRVIMIFKEYSGIAKDIKLRYKAVDRNIWNQAAAKMSSIFR